VPWAEVGDEHLDALPLPLGFEIIANHEDARKLAMGSSSRLQGYCRETSDFGEAGLKLPDQFEGALREGVADEGVGVAPSCHSGRYLVGLGVVLHRA